MGVCLQPRLIALAAFLACLAGSPAAASTFFGIVYEVGGAVPQTPSKIALSLSYGTGVAKQDLGNLSSARALQAVDSFANWEVTVYFNAVDCKIHCDFRQKRDPLGRTPIAGFLTPPMAIIRVYTDSESKPAIFIVDPAGVSIPVAAGRLPDGYDFVLLPGRKLFAVSSAPQGQSQNIAVPQDVRIVPANSTRASTGAALQLRI